MVENRDRHGEGQHADVVRGPDAHPHGGGAAGQPEQARAPLRGGDAAGEIEGGVRGENRQKDGERH
jgi:hypothetical protein